jgi:bifunctional DNase/RNase
MQIEMELSRILMSESQDTHYVELREKQPEVEDEPRTFPIVIGFTEASAIERRLMGHVPPRPQTHELLSSVIESLGYQLNRVVINDLSDHTFYARLMLHSSKHPEDVREIDSRPSDAIALAVAEDVPIFVSSEVLDEVSQTDQS